MIALALPRTNAVLLRTFVVLGWAFVSAIPSPAIHNGGVAPCSVCHTMHNSQNGVLVDPEHPLGNPWSLRAGTPSDLCLSCHAAGHGAVFGADPLMPPPQKGAGNFVFLLEDNLNDGPEGAQQPISGDAAGHNIVAPSRGVAADAIWIRAPGGSYPSWSLGCTSCHDPHGNSSFRMLRGIGRVQGGFFTFLYPAPQAAGISLALGHENRANHTAYRSGVSQWCANCHGRDYHDRSSPSFDHETDDRIDSDEVDAYNRYNGTDDPYGGTYATAYLPEVPFEDPAVTTTSTFGPNRNSRIHCLTCHRAHASSGPRSGRWDFNIEFLRLDGVISGSYPIPDPYNSPNQRSLCMKCHPDEIPNPTASTVVLRSLGIRQSFPTDRD